MGTLDPAYARAAPVTGGRERRDASDDVLDVHLRLPKLRWAGDGITPERRPRLAAAGASQRQERAVVAQE